MLQAPEISYACPDQVLFLVFLIMDLCTCKPLIPRDSPRLIPRPPRTVGQQLRHGSPSPHNFVQRKSGTTTAPWSASGASAGGWISFAMTIKPPWPQTFPSLGVLASILSSYELCSFTPSSPFHLSPPSFVSETTPSTMSKTNAFAGLRGSSLRAAQIALVVAPAFVTFGYAKLSWPRESQH